MFENFENFSLSVLRLLDILYHKTFIRIANKEDPNQTARPPDKSVLENYFLYRPKHMLWDLWTSSEIRLLLRNQSDLGL